MENPKEDKGFREVMLVLSFCYLGVLFGILLAINSADRSELLSDVGNIFALLVTTLLGCFFIPGAFAFWPPIILLYRVDFFKKYQGTFAGFAIAFFFALLLSFGVNKIC